MSFEKSRAMHGRAGRENFIASASTIIARVASEINSLILLSLPVAADVSLTEFRHLVHNFRVDEPSNCKAPLPSPSLPLPPSSNS